MTPRRRALLAIWTLPSALFLAVTAYAYFQFRIPPPAPLDDTTRALVIAPLRAAVEQRGEAGQAVGPGGSLIATLWLDGKAYLRIDAHGDTLAEATDDAARQLRASGLLLKLTPYDRERARIQVDLVAGRGPLAGGGGAFDAVALPGIASSLALNPGIDGIGVRVADQDVLILPHELVVAKLLQSQRPSSALPDFAMGTDMARIEQLVRRRVAGATNTRPDPKLQLGALFRFRTEAFVERPTGTRTGPPLPLTRGIPPPPAVSAAALRTAALAGAQYLVDHLGPNGRYAYEHDLSNGHQTDPSKVGGNYSMPRHAGVTYFLAETYRITHETWLREPIERAFHHLSDLIAEGACGTTLPDGTAIDCVRDRGEDSAQLGSTALAVVALAEYQRATGDARYLPLATKLAAFILYMQRPDGSFRHVYDPKTHLPDDEAQMLYYSGEAALALTRMWVVTNDARYGDAAVRGLDWLVDWYDFFLGGFFYGEEHWTCIAAEAVYGYPPARKEKYREFCDGYGAFLRQQQAEVGELPDEDDLAGSYNVTPFVLPFNTPAGSRTEAMISAYLLGEHHGHGDPLVRDQIRATLGYVIGQQIRPDSDFGVVGPADGGMPGSPIERNVRIDFVQHTCSAMIRASEWIDSPPP